MRLVLHFSLQIHNTHSYIYEMLNIVLIHSYTANFANANVCKNKIAKTGGTCMTSRSLPSQQLIWLKTCVAQDSSHAVLLVLGPARNIIKVLC